MGAADIYDSGAITATSAKATNLPNDGDAVYVRLLSRINGHWHFIDYDYHSFLQPFAITAMQRLGNGHVLLKGIGPNNHTGTIEWASTLKSLPQILATVAADSNGNFQYDDGSTNANSRRFYWISSP
jgi:hypothetical protein